MTDAVTTLMGLAFFVVAALLALAALFGNGLRLRLRGGRQCPRCGYDMTHADTMTCSECGRTSTRARTFTRGRRRWRWVVVALLIACGAHVVQCVPGIQDRGWIAAVPSSVLVFVAPVDESAWSGVNEFLGFLMIGSAVDPWLAEAAWRCQEAALASWQSDVLIDRIMREHPELWRGAVLTQPRWPADGPVHVEFSQLIVDGLPPRVQVRGRPAGGDEAWAVIGSYGHRTGPIADAPMEPDCFAFDAPANADGTIRFEVEFWREATAEAPAQRIWSGVSPPIVRRGTIDDAIEPTTDADTLADFPDHLFPLLYLAPDRRTLTFELFEPTNIMFASARRWVFAVTVTVRADGRLVARGEVIHHLPLPELQGSPGMRLRGPWIPYDLEWLVDPASIDLRAAESIEIEMRGDPRVAMQQLRYSAYWSGVWYGDAEHVRLDAEPKPFGWKRDNW